MTALPISMTISAGADLSNPAIQLMVRKAAATKAMTGWVSTLRKPSMATNLRSLALNLQTVLKKQMRGVMMMQKMMKSGIWSYRFFRMPQRKQLTRIWLRPTILLPRKPYFLLKLKCSYVANKFIDTGRPPMMPEATFARHITNDYLLTYPKSDWLLRFPRLWNSSRYRNCYKTRMAARTLLAGSKYSNSYIRGTTKFFNFKKQNEQSTSCHEHKSLQVKKFPLILMRMPRIAKSKMEGNLANLLLAKNIIAIETIVKQSVNTLNCWNVIMMVFRGFDMSDASLSQNIVTFSTVKGKNLVRTIMPIPKIIPACTFPGRWWKISLKLWMNCQRMPMRSPARNVIQQI